jgi:hypothetical protein
VYGAESDLACIAAQLKENLDLLHKLTAMLPKLRDWSTPSIEVLATYKDQMRISDHNWIVTIKTFELGSYTKILAIRKQQQHNNKTMAIQPVGDAGYKIPLIPLLEHLLNQNPPSDPTQPVVVKFTFDRATVTSGKRIQQELGGLQILTPGKSLAEVKSPKNCHINLIYIGGETDEELHEGLANISKVFSHIAGA